MKRLMLSLGFSAVVAIAPLIPVAGANAQVVSSSPSLAGINHIVMIYEENHSFDNLYGGWEGVNGLTNVPLVKSKQVNQAGATYLCLQMNDANLAALPATCSDNTTATTFGSAFPDSPFTIDTYIPATATTCASSNDEARASALVKYGDATLASWGITATQLADLKALANSANAGIPAADGVAGGCTRDLVHRYYQEQYNIDGGKMDRYVTGEDAMGLTMGHFDTTKLPIYTYLHSQGAPNYVISDNFFQSAFGGSFLNHQFFISAAAPTWYGLPNDGSAADLHSVVDANGMPTSYGLYKAGAGVKDSMVTASCTPAANRGPTPPGVTCGDFAINTTQPFYQPYSPGTPDASRLPPQKGTTIGDELSAASVDWAWYSGGWSNADGDTAAPGWTNGTDGKTCQDPDTASNAVYPNCFGQFFQFHHQVFNFYANYAPGTAARTAHLQDEAAFISSATGSTATCGLKPVSFIKPYGAENEHPGYASDQAGESHLVSLIKDIEGSVCAKDTMILVTYDEFGGQWDHVSPPSKNNPIGPYDQWGPGTRIPALTIAPGLTSQFTVDHTEHDTTSFIATVEHKFNLKPLGTRDAAVPDMTSIWTASPPSK